MLLGHEPAAARASPAAGTAAGGAAAPARGGSKQALAPALTPPAKRGLAAVRISTIDNYQGEEAEVVILSLVRSAPTTPATFKGFMRESNRVCVALSRARSGFYLFGNADLHRAASPLWRDIVDKLSAGGEIGAGLPIACHRHPATVTSIRTPQDWAAAPSGGCLLPCGERLECGHVRRRSGQAHRAPSQSRR
jgi:hypothetical protein